MFLITEVVKNVQVWKKYKLRHKSNRKIDELKDRRSQILEEKLASIYELKRVHKKYFDKLYILYNKGLID